MRKTITRLLLLAALTVAPLSHAVDCELFYAGDTNYIDKLNLLATGCSATTGSPSGSQTNIPRADAAGTINAITATYSPAITLTDKMTVLLINTAGANSSTAPTFNPNTLGALTITARGGNALVAGDTGTVGAALLLEYNLANTRWELLNPQKVRAASDLVGNIPVTNLNSGTSASSSTYWRGDATWAAITAMTNPMTTGGDVIYGGSSGTPTRLANGTSGQVLTSSGGTAAPYWSSVSGGAGSLTDTYVGYGSGANVLTGEGDFTYDASTNTMTVGKLIVPEGTSILLGTSGSTVGNIGFRNATSGTITLAPPTGALGMVTVTLPAATDTLVGKATTDTLTNKSIAYGQLTGLGTGVSTALGINIGSAGAPVLFNGAGGTPSSITLTNGTGLPLATGVTGNLAVTNLNSGTSASSSTFWRGDGTWAAPTGTGTVTHTGGALTSNAVVLGAGSDDTKVVAGITSDGTSALNLGEAGTSVGKVVLANATSGSITVQPPTGALGSIIATIAATTGTHYPNPMTTGGDVIYGGASGVPTRLANGSSGQVLTSAGGTSAPTWETPAAGAVYGARVYRSDALSVSHLSTTAIAFDAETFDSNSMHDTVTNNSRIVLNKVGKWRISWQVVYAANATGSRAAYILLNGSTVVSDRDTNNAGGAILSYVNGSDVVVASAITDYIEVIPYQNSGGSLALTVGTATVYLSAIFEGT